jgi:hypothetical protein
MAGIKQLKTLTLEMDDGGTPLTVQCQLSQAQLVDNPQTSDLTSFCGTETFSTPRYSLELSGWQDYGTVESVFDMLHTSYLSFQTDATADKPIACTLAVGSKTRAFDAKPQNDPNFGGTAGDALTADVTLDVIGEVTDGTVAG